MNDLEYDFDDSLNQNTDNAFQGNEIVQSEDGTQNPSENKENLTKSDSDRHKSDKTKSPSKRHWQGGELVIRTSLNMRRILRLVRMGNVNTRLIVKISHQAVTRLQNVR